MTSLLLGRYYCCCVPKYLGSRPLDKKIWQKVVKVRIKSLLAIGLVLTLALVGLVGCTSGGTGGGELPSELRIDMGSQQEGLWVNGHGEVNVAPDIAILE